MVGQLALLPETLHAEPAPAVQRAATCCAATGSWARSPRFLALALASGIPFNGMFLYVLSAPVFLGEHLQLAADAVLLVLRADHRRHHGSAPGCRAGWPGASSRKHQIRHGFVIMLAASLVNVALNLLFTPHACWAMLPVAMFSFGWALMVPVVTLLVLDLVPERRGMAVVGAGLHRQHGQRPGGRRDRAAGHAFDAGAGLTSLRHDEHRRGRLDLGQAARDLSAGRAKLARLHSSAGEASRPRGAGR